MKNPIVAIREEKGLNVTEMGILSNVSTMTIQRIERGSLSKVSSKVLDTIEKWGYDRERVILDYGKWRDHRVRQLQEKVWS